VSRLRGAVNEHRKSVTAAFLASQVIYSGKEAISLLKILVSRPGLEPGTL